MAEVNKTIGAHPSRDYSSIALWESDLDNAGVYSIGDDAIGTLYNDSLFDEHILLNGGNLNSITLTVASGERHDGTAGTGARIAPTTGSSSSIFHAEHGIANITLEWFEINGDNTDDGVGLFVSNYGGATAILQQLLVHGIYDSVYLSGNTNGIYVYRGAVNVLNCIVYDIEVGVEGVRGLEIGLISNTCNVCNCTVYNVFSNASGSFTSSAVCYFLNDIATNSYRNLIGMDADADFPADFFPSGFSDATVSNNMSSDATASGTGSLTSKVAASQFVSTGTGSEDLHLKDGADAIDAGTDLGTTPTGVNIDINGRDRDAQGDTWDIGAHEYILSSSIGLYINGFGLLNENIPLYIKGYIADSIYCYISGHDLINSGSEIDLFTQGHIGINSNTEITLYTSGTNVDTNKLIFLTIEGLAFSDNSYIPLFTHGVASEGASGIFDSIPLIVYHDQSENLNITLFMQNIQTEVPTTEDLNLFIEGVYNLINANIPLFVSQEGVYADATLFIKGTGTYTGASLDSDSLPLYIYRPNISSIVPLIMYNSNQEANSYIPLYVNAILGSLNENIPLVFSGAHIASNSYIPLYVLSATEINDNIPLVMPNVLAEINENIPLVVWHEGGTLNSYIPLYSFGAYLINDNIPLVMPSVLDTVNDSILLYQHGY